jgi:hypothetical protein
MRIGAIKILGAALALAITAASAQAQVGGFGGGPGGGGASRQPFDKNSHKSSDPPKAKADDKAYNSALKGLPDKQYDPWHGIH